MLAVPQAREVFKRILMGRPDDHVSGATAFRPRGVAYDPHGLKAVAPHPTSDARDSTGRALRGSTGRAGGLGA